MVLFAGMQTPPSPQSQQQAAAAVAQADPAAVAELLTSLQKLGFSITPPGEADKVHVAFLRILPVLRDAHIQSLNT